VRVKGQDARFSVHLSFRARERQPGPVPWCSTWAGDRATRGRDLSTDPGARTRGPGGLTARPCLFPPASYPLSDWHQRDTSQGVWGRIPHARAAARCVVSLCSVAFIGGCGRLIMVVIRGVSAILSQRLNPNTSLRESDPEARDRQACVPGRSCLHGILLATSRGAGPFQSVGRLAVI
jgi:hypothetical protein